MKSDRKVASAKWKSRELLSPHRNIIKQAKIIKTNFVKALENNEMPTEIKRIMNSGKFLCLFHTPLPVWSAVLKLAAYVPTLRWWKISP